MRIKKKNQYSSVYNKNDLKYGQEWGFKYISTYKMCLIISYSKIFVPPRLTWNIVKEAHDSINDGKEALYE